MKAAIEVNNRQEAELIGNALTNPTTKVLMLVLGALSSLPKASALRVLKIVKDQFDDGEPS